MNPFQRAREEANAARATLLGDKAASAAPASILLAEIPSRLNLGIDSVAAGAPELGDGDACLIRQERYIYVRKNVAAHEFAGLVAHELGHWFLDASKAPVTVASLAELNGVEESPAVVRIEAYGARERQELQANVFARELLLPRAVARALFLSGKGAQSTAADLGLPIRLVRQQMLDAILLPAAAPPEDKVLHPPTPDQDKAARAKERFVNVVAGPGTGKTSTLIHRVKYLIEHERVDPAHILVLTFTNKAAFELVERLRLSGIKNSAYLWAGTFHSFGLEFLRKYHDAFGLDNRIVVADKLNAAALLSRNLPKIPLKHHLRVEDPYEWLGPVLQGITRLKEELVSPAQYRARLSQLAPAAPAIEARREDQATLYEAHERLLRDSQLVDYVDLIALPALAITSDRPRFSELADKFQYVLVDEYQDVTAAMVHLVKQLAYRTKGLWVVGDVRQAIHHWRGASLESLLVFEQTFREHAASTKSKIKKYPLELNRRSSQEIVDLTTRCGETHVLQQHLPLDRTKAAAGKSGKPPVLMSCESRGAIKDAVVAAVKQAHAKGVTYRQQAVLSRWTTNVEDLARSLRANGVPVLYIGELAQRPEVKRFLCLMQLLTERLPRALVGLAGMEGLSMPLADVDELIKRARSDRGLQRGRWIDQGVAFLSAQGRAAAKNLANLLYGHSRYSNPWSFLCDMLLERRFALPATSDDSVEARVARIALWQFMHSAHVTDGDGKRPTLPRYLLRLQTRQRLGETYGDRELPPEALALDAVRVQTVHGSKGLEYDIVHLSHVDDCFGPHKDEPWMDEDVKDLVPPEVLGSTADKYRFEQSVERNNLLYVAVSRPRHNLVLYEDGAFAQKSRPLQLKEPGPFLTKTFADPSPPPAPRNSPKGVPQPSRLLPFEEFDCYTRCPRQHWYRYTCGLPSEREFEAPVRARFAVMAALKQVASGVEKKPESALLGAWSEQKLAPSHEDPTLWRDANSVLARGVTLVKNSGGVFDEPRTAVAGLPVQFPWVMKQDRGFSLTLHLTLFSPRGMYDKVKLLRPMLSGLPKHAEVRIANLLTGATRQEKPSGMIQKTDAWAAASRFPTGESSPRFGKQCQHCAYQTICPGKPA